MTICLTASTKAPVTAAVTQINTNCGFPNSYGTITWGIPKQSADGTFWFIPKPIGPWGNTSSMFTTEQMMQGVVNVIEEESNSSWFPSVSI